MKKYELTEEHRAQLKPWGDKWIANAMSTAPTTDEDWVEIVQNVIGLYKAAGLKPPPKHRIVRVPSPIAGYFATGAASWIWYCRKRGIDAHRVDEPESAAQARDAKLDMSHWYVVPGIEYLIRSTPKEYLLCAQKSYRQVSPGNQWSGWAAYISFFRYVAKLDIDYTNWHHYERLAELSGPRWIHEEFCIVSDRPEILTVDDENRPHNDTGPFCRWRDGVSLYSIHGVRVPAWVVEHPNDITVDHIRDEENSEVRRVMIERYGESRYLVDVGAELVDMDSLTGCRPTARPAGRCGVSIHCHPSGTCGCETSCGGIPGHSSDGCEDQEEGPRLSRR